MAREVVKKVKVKGPKGQAGYAFLYDDDTIFIEWVRFSHPHITTPWKKEGDKGPAKFSVIAMLGKETHAKAIDLVEEFIAEILAKNKVKKLKSDRLFMTDGDDHEDTNREGFMCISAKESKRPPIRGRNGKPIDREDAEEDELFVGGHWGSVLLRPWYQDSKEWGKRVNCGLSAAQFLQKDETFGQGGISDEDLDDTVRSHGDDDDDDGSYDDEDEKPARRKKPSRSRDDDDDDEDEKPRRRKKPSRDDDDEDDDI